jgi:hypothetical protein
MAPRRATDHWSFDKRIPIALIGTMVFQFGTGVWYFSNLDSRVTNLEKITERTSSVSISLASDAQVTKDRVLKLEMLVTDIRDGISEIKEILVKGK